MRVPNAKLSAAMGLFERVLPLKEACSRSDWRNRDSVGHSRSAANWPASPPRRGRLRHGWGRDHPAVHPRRYRLRAFEEEPDRIRRTVFFVGQSVLRAHRDRHAAAACSARRTVGTRDAAGSSLRSRSHHRPPQSRPMTAMRRNLSRPRRGANRTTSDVSRRLNLSPIEMGRLGAQCHCADHAHGPLSRLHVLRVLHHLLMTRRKSHGMHRRCFRNASVSVKEQNFRVRDSVSLQHVPEWLTESGSAAEHVTPPPATAADNVGCEPPQQKFLAHEVARFGRPRCVSGRQPTSPTLIRSGASRFTPNAALLARDLTNVFVSSTLFP